MFFHRMFFTLSILGYVPTFGSRQNLRDLIKRNTVDLKHVLEEVHDLRYDIRVMNEKISIEEELVNDTKESPNDVSTDSKSNNNNIQSGLLAKLDPQMKNLQVLNGFNDLKLAVHKSLEQVREDQICVINRTEQIDNYAKALEAQLQNQSVQTKSELLHLTDSIVNDTRKIRRDYSNLKSSVNSLQTEFQSVEQNSLKLISKTELLRDDVNDLLEEGTATQESIIALQRELVDLKKNMRLLYALATDVSSWKYFQRSFYRVFETKRNFDDASTFCENLNSYLAVVTSKEENAFLVVNMKSRDIYAAWIGGNDRQTEGQWEWPSKEPFNYTNWNKREPNDSGGNEDCLAIYQYSGKWNDYPCTSNRQFICEMESK